MGNNQSHGGVVSGGVPEMQGGTNHSVLPVDNPPYPGPAHEYRIVAINAKLKMKMGFAAKMGDIMVSSDLSTYYETLQQQYAEYYKLFTFFQVPLQKSQNFTSAHVPFHGIMSRPKHFVPSPESWQLQIKNIQIQFSLFQTGHLFSYGHTVSLPPNVQGIYNTISGMAQTGAKLVCMECNGNTFSPGMGMGLQGGFIYGVDVFFDVPQHPNPTMYTYTAHSTPILIGRSYGNVQVQCDWTGTLNMYLNEGWKLIDVLIPNLESGQMENQQQRRGNSHMHNFGTQTEQTIWFFEKELSMVNDRAPKYQVTLVEYYIHAKVSGLTSVKTDFDLGQVLSDMGERGWTLVSVLDTPQTVVSGFGKATRGIILFFQRPLLANGPGSGQLFIQPQNQMVPGTQPVGQAGPAAFGNQGMMGAQSTVVPPGGMVPQPGPPMNANYNQPPPPYSGMPPQQPGMQPPVNTMGVPPPTGRISPNPPYPPQ